jgi:hypothetical protein
MTSSQVPDRPPGQATALGRSLDYSRSCSRSSAERNSECFSAHVSGSVNSLMSPGLTHRLPYECHDMSIEDLLLLSNTTTTCQSLIIQLKVMLCKTAHKQVHDGTCHLNNYVQNWTLHTLAG